MTATLKKAPRNRSDITWNHCISVARDTRKLQCKYCLWVIKGEFIIEASLGWYSKGYWSLQGCY